MNCSCRGQMFLATVLRSPGCKGDACKNGTECMNNAHTNLPMKVELSQPGKYFNKVLQADAWKATAAHTAERFHTTPGLKVQRFAKCRTNTYFCSPHSARYKGPPQHTAASWGCNEPCHTVLPTLQSTLYTAPEHLACVLTKRLQAHASYARMQSLSFGKPLQRRPCRAGRPAC